MATYFQSSRICGGTEGIRSKEVFIGQGGLHEVAPENLYTITYFPYP